MAALFVTSRMLPKRIYFFNMLKKDRDIAILDGL